MVGVVDLKSIAENRFFCGWERREVGDLCEPGIAEFLERTSPCNYTDRITTPLRMNVRGRDPRVPREPERKMAEALEQAGQEVWFTEMPDAGHGIGGAAPPDIIYVATNIVEFLDRVRE